MTSPITTSPIMAGRSLSRRLRTTGALLLAAGACAGCGTVAHAGSARPAVAPPARVSVATSVGTSGATWAVVPMGAASGPNEFWQVFLLAAGQAKWSLDTPPDIATNGAPALAPTTGTSLVTGVRPSLYLRFSPVSSTDNAGRSWSPRAPAPALATVPDALAAAPQGSDLLAVSQSGEVASGTGAAWATLTSERKLAASPAGRSCGLTGITAASYSPADVPLLGAACSRPGVAGILSQAGTSWRLSGPTLPPALAGQPVQVLGLTRDATGTVALLLAGRAANAEVVAAWQDSTGNWSLSPALPLRRAAVQTTSFGDDGAVAVVLSTDRAVVIGGPGGNWATTPAIPAATSATVALPAPGVTEVLCATGSRLTVWQLTDASRAWAKTQSINVPIQYGSSG